MCLYRHHNKSVIIPFNSFVQSYRCTNFGKLAKYSKSLPYPPIPIFNVPDSPSGLNISMPYQGSPPGASYYTEHDDPYRSPWAPYPMYQQPMVI